MPPPDENYLIKTIVDGVLMKLGDVILMHSPGLVKKGAIVTLVIFRKKLKKNPKKNVPPRTK